MRDLIEIKQSLYVDKITHVDLHIPVSKGFIAVPALVLIKDKSLKIRHFMCPLSLVR